MSNSKESSKKDVKNVEKFLHDLDLPTEEFGTISFWGHKPTWKEFKKRLSEMGLKTCSTMVYLQRSFLIGLDVIVDSKLSVPGKLPNITTHINISRHYSRSSERMFDFKPVNIPVINAQGQTVDVIKAYPDPKMMNKDLKKD